MARMTTRRKLAIATWSPPREGNIYGKLTVDATQALAYLEFLRERSGEKVTITHLVGKAVAEAMKRAPSLNGRIVFGRYVPYDTVDISYLVVLEEGANLAKAKICDADRKSVADIARELRELAERLRKGKDADFEKSKGLIRLLPTWLLRWMIAGIGFLATGLGLEIRALGVERFPFGSCIITSVGMFGLEEGFVPPTPFARVPVYVLIGSITERPVVVAGKIVVQPRLTLTATIDHRFIDGFQGGILAKVVREVLENPWRLEGMEGPPRAVPDINGGKCSGQPAEERGDTPRSVRGEPAGGRGS
ncbi:MAG: 2-oxo acid dehydrogenase [Deltaproteobacteria bacterium]|nr:MAG: 2-oxo acid dehydrogenase [Deltaproteobacteria bacterium]